MQFLCVRLGMAHELLVPVALFMGMCLGYVLGRLHSKHTLDAYKQGQEDAHRRQVELDRAKGGPCWVRGQVEGRGPGS